MIYTQLSWREETMAQFVAEHFGTPMPDDFEYANLDVDWCGYVHIVANAAALFADLIAVDRRGAAAGSDEWYELLEGAAEEFKRQLLSEARTLCCAELAARFQVFIAQTYPRHIAGDSSAAS